MTYQKSIYVYLSSLFYRVEFVHWLGHKCISIHHLCTNRYGHIHQYNSIGVDYPIFKFDYSKSTSSLLIPRPDLESKR